MSTNTTNNNNNKEEEALSVDPKEGIMRIHQTIFEASKGNSLQACIASLFCTPLHQVPDFLALASTPPSSPWTHHLSSYTLLHHNCTLVKIDLLPHQGRLPFPVSGNPLCLAAGKSPRGEHRHVVLARILEEGDIVVVHDPHPDNTGLDGLPVWVGVFAKVFGPP